MTKKTNTNWFHFFAATFNQMLAANISGNDLLIYLIIRQRADNSGESSISVAAIAEKSSLSEPTVKRATKNLVKNNFLSKKKIGNANVYRVIEQIPTGDDLATFPYLPKKAAMAQQHIKEFDQTGVLPENSQVQIIKNQVNINNIQIVNIGNIGQEIKDPRLQEQMAKLIEKALEKVFQHGEK